SGITRRYGDIKCYGNSTKSNYVHFLSVSTSMHLDPSIANILAVINMLVVVVVSY
ncbi:hypothetical protein ACJX0J_005552, partial [Zea mays]